MRALVVALALSIASIASAQSLPPMFPPEAMIRAHFDSVVDVREATELHVPSAWWARTNEPDGTVRGRLVFARGHSLIVGPGADALSQVLRADSALTRPGRWTASALLAVMRALEVPIPLATNVITTHRVAALRPHLTRAAGVLRLTLYTHRGGPPEPPATEQYWVTRAVLTIDADDQLHWETRDVNLDGRGRER